MANNINKRMLDLAVKYYGTTDLSRLQPHQLEKITTWATRMNPDQGKNQSRKAEYALRQNRKYRGKGTIPKSQYVGK